MSEETKPVDQKVDEVKEVMKEAEVTYKPGDEFQGVTIATNEEFISRAINTLQQWSDRNITKSCQDGVDRTPDDEETVVESGTLVDCPYSVTNRAVYVTFLNDQKPSSKVIMYYKSDPKFQQKQIKTSTRRQLLADGMDPLLVKYFGEWSEKHFYMIKWKTSTDKGQNNFQTVITKVYKTFLHCLNQGKDKGERYDTIYSKLKELLDSSKQVPAHVVLQDRCYISREAMVIKSVDPVIGKFIEHVEKMCKSMPKVTAIVEAFVDVLGREPSRIVLTKAKAVEPKVESQQSETA